MNMRVNEIPSNCIDVPIKQAYANVVDGIHAGPDTTFVGYTGYEQHPYLPHRMSDDDFLFDKEAFLIMGYAWNREWSRKDYEPRRGVWWGGPKGAGKTTLTEQFFARLGVPVIALTCNRRLPLSDFIDKMVPDGQGGWITVPGPLKIAMEMGFPVILNEPSRMEPADLVAMHDIIDRGIHTGDDGTIIRAKRGFLVFATDNTMGFGDDTGSYPDANLLDAATMSRFLKAELTYPNVRMETQILVNRCGMDKAVAAKHVGFANAVRNAYISGKSAVTMGTRELLDWAQASAYFAAMRDQPGALFALKRVLGGCPQSEMKALEALYESHFGGQSA